MSAEIIQFGKPQSLTAAAKRYAKASRRRVRRKTVRFALDGELYEVEFYGNAVRHVFAIRYRISGGGVQE